VTTGVLSRLRSHRIRPETYRWVALGALVTQVVIILTGGAVRLTGSGLGCSEWPNCEQGQFVAPMEFHAWIEFGNRLFTGVVSIAVVLALFGALARVPRRRDLIWWSAAMVVGVIAQILLGAIVVLTHLVPAAVSAHFLLSVALVWIAVMLYVRAREGSAPPETLVAPAVSWLTRAMLVTLMAVLFLGTLVTGSGPHSGDPGEVDRLGFEIRDITMAHTSAVWTLVGLTVAALATVYATGAPRPVRRWGWGVVAVLAAQATVGYLQYFNGVPALLVGIHLAGAVAAWFVVLRFALAQRRRAIVDTDTSDLTGPGDGTGTSEGTGTGTSAAGASPTAPAAGPGEAVRRTPTAPADAGVPVP
jgi:heme a synthase